MISSRNRSNSIKTIDWCTGHPTIKPGVFRGIQPRKVSRLSGSTKSSADSMGMIRYLSLRFQDRICKLMETFQCRQGHLAFPRGDGLYHRPSQAVALWGPVRISARDSYGPARPLRCSEKEIKMSGSNAGALRQVGLESSYTRERVPSPSSPTATREPGLFSAAIIEENALDRGKRAARAGLAFTLQAAIIGVLLLVPLLFTEGIDLYKFNNTVLIAPPPPGRAGGRRPRE